MHNPLWHALIHLGVHAVRHMSSHRAPSPAPRPSCQRCDSSAGDMYQTKCCKVRLCAGCSREWMHAGGNRCVICGA